MSILTLTGISLRQVGYLFGYTATHLLMLSSSNSFWLPNKIKVLPVLTQTVHTRHLNCFIVRNLLVELLFKRHSFRSKVAQ